MLSISFWKSHYIYAFIYSILSYYFLYSYLVICVLNWLCNSLFIWFNFIFSYFCISFFMSVSCSWNFSSCCFSIYFLACEIALRFSFWASSFIYFSKIILCCSRSRCCYSSAVLSTVFLGFDFWFLILGEAALRTGLFRGERASLLSLVVAFFEFL